ncbi:MAG: hypothetical protein P4L67_04180 [Candidatus Pacebacteria bacterium]|nr:hypothetical protein [Candidatus Paceibacterota bacterium]
MPSISPELLVPIAKLLARGKFAKQESNPKVDAYRVVVEIVKAYVDAFKKIDAVKEKDPARSSEKAKVKVAITAIMSENPLAKMK